MVQILLSISNCCAKFYIGSAWSLNSDAVPKSTVILGLCIATSRNLHIRGLRSETYANMRNVPCRSHQNRHFDPMALHCARFERQPNNQPGRESRGMSPNDEVDFGVRSQNSGPSKALTCRTRTYTRTTAIRRRRTSLTKFVFWLKPP